MQLNHKATRLGIFGASGTGKTTFAEKYLLNSPAKVRFIFDREGEWSERLKLPGVGSIPRLGEFVSKGWLLFDPDVHFKGRHEDALEFFADFALQVSERIPGRKLFVVDELQLLISGHQIGKEMKTLIQTGRRYGVDFVLIQQQPNLVHNSVLAQLTEVVFFRTETKHALEFPEGMGMDTERIRTLPDFRYIHRDCRTGKLTEGPSKRV